MNTTLGLLAAVVGIGIGVALGVGLLVPIVGNLIFGALDPRRIIDGQQRRVATWLWAAMASALVFIGSGALWVSWWLIGFGSICACVAVGCGVHLWRMLALSAYRQRVAQEAAFQQELEQALRGER